MSRRALCLAFPLLFACAAAPAADTDGDESSGSSGISGASTSGAPTTGEQESSGTTGDAWAGPRLNELQALGTHNSYHLSPGLDVPEFDYTHRPLDEQLALQGVRKFELDIHFAGVGEPIGVYHVDALDTGSTCATLGECLQTMKAWSDAHPAHHPLYVMIEVKSLFAAAAADALLATLEDQIVAVWPRERLIVPDDIQGAAPTLRDGVAASGWPAIDAVRGRALFVLHDKADWRDAYTAGDSTQGKLLFPDAFGALDVPYAAVHTINDPIADAATIAAAVDAGHLVRTRADADNVEPAAGDTTRATAALASGAQFISTDYPPPKGPTFDYVFEIPGGTPSRCNPRSAPPGCTAAQIEDPQAIGP